MQFCSQAEQNDDDGGRLDSKQSYDGDVELVLRANVVLKQRQLYTTSLHTAIGDDKRWLGSLAIRASDLLLNGRDFDHRPLHYRWLVVGWVTVGPCGVKCNGKCTEEMVSVNDDAIHEVTRGLRSTSATPRVDWPEDHACG